MHSEPFRPLELDPGPIPDAGGQPYAVVDIGSNSVRLVVYDRLSRAPFPRFNEKSLCRLGDGLAQTGTLSPDGFRRTVEALRRFRAVATAMAVSRIDVIATEAVRKASNGQDLIAAIADKAGLSVQVLSGEQEAHYASLGVISGFYRPSGIVGDMGGGSLEIATVHDDRVGLGAVSMPLGALPVQALLAHSNDEAKRRVDAILRESVPLTLTEPVFYAVGGGWRSFAKVHMASVEAPVRVPHGYALSGSAARAFARRLWQLPDADMSMQPGVPTRRAPTLRAAALVLDRVLKRLRPERVIFSALGVREGWLYTQLPVEERYRDPLVEGAQSFGKPNARVPDFAAALVKWTDELFQHEPVADRRLRVSACALSDTGWRDHPDVRALDCFNRLARFPFLGVDHTERVFIAAVIHSRYGGSLGDLALRSAIDLLSSSQRQRALILGRVLLLGYRLSGSVAEILADSRLRIIGDTVRLEVGTRARVPDSEVVRDRLRLVAAALGTSRYDIVDTGPSPNGP